MVKYLLLLMAGIMAASCVFDADRCDVPADQPHNIMFTLSLEGENTKATWAEGYTSVEGVPFDYRILPDQIRVVVYAYDETPLGEIQNLYYWPINESHTAFQFMGQMPEAFAEHFDPNTEPRYRFMVLANCADNLSGPQYITYSHTQLIEPSKDDKAAPSVGYAIPMWGVKVVNMKSLFTEGTKDIGEIWLLRAAAKVEVKLSKNVKSKGTTIKSATLKYYNQTGYVLPSGAFQIDRTEGLDQENCIKVYRRAAVNLPFVKDELTGNYYVYVTEYDNENYPGERNKISLEFNIKDEVKSFEDAISFCEYVGGSPQEGTDYNIVRNHIYQFEILRIAGDNLELQYTVADWDAERWDSNNDGIPDKDFEEHELAYPTYHNPVVPREYLTLEPGKITDYKITKQPQMYYNANHPEEGAFECFFQIVAPEYVRWKPGIVGSEANYRIRIYENVTSSNLSGGKLAYDSADEAKQTDLGCCQPNQWYRILVFPLNGKGAGENHIDFTISYYQEWTQQYIHLYINGEYDRIRWPGSGTNPKIITIAHVGQQVTSEIDE